MRVVLDASVVVDYLRTKRGDNPFFLLRPTHDFVLSLVTVAELYSGSSAQKGGAAQNMLEDILAGAEIVTPTMETARRAGKLRVDYQLSLGDSFVAALAIEEKLAILSLDKKAFSRVKEIKLLPLPAKIR